MPLLGFLTEAYCEKVKLTVVPLLVTEKEGNWTAVTEILGCIGLKRVK